MSPHLEGADALGATPLDADDLDGLIPTYIATRADLNIAEQANIESATLWAYRTRSRVDVEVLLTTTFMADLHRRMFGAVWSWAGKQRFRETNIGVDPASIPTQTKALLDDMQYWHTHATYEAVERAVRFHHRLVSVHPFRNGNGRHARFAADLYLHSIEHPRLAWGSHRLDADDDDRRRYIDALRHADRGDIEPLVEFAST